MVVDDGIIGRRIRQRAVSFLVPSPIILIAEFVFCWTPQIGYGNNK